MKRIFIFISLAMTFAVSDAQIIDLIGPEIFKSRVSLVDEFIKRFNRELTPPHKPQVAPEDSAAAYIIQLFNGANFSCADDPMLLAATEFAKESVASNVRLNYADSCWYARATCHGTYRKQPVEFNLILRVEPRDKDMYRWALTGAEGNLFSLPAKESGSGFMIFPDDHETNFMSLTDMTATQTESIGLYASDNAKIDPLSVFLTMVYGGQLKIEYVRPLEFVFQQIPGWEFTIRFFEREELNSGWLIDTIVRK